MSTDDERVATETAAPRPADTGPGDAEPAPLGAPAEVPRTSLRYRLRSNPATRTCYRVVVFVVGLLFIAGGVALSVLPGPLTIPPVLVGLWIWSTEFAWAQRLFQRFKVKGREAWAHAKRRPVSSIAVTVGGIVAVVVGVWALRYFGVIEWVRNAVGL